jgi:hypothetical protein
MVIVRPDGSIILDGGDPAFASVQDLGAEAPTNFILDPDPNKPLTQFILEKFSIPFQPHSITGRVLGGVLPGYDIRNQDATTMMRLSLAVELKNAPGPGSNEPAGVSEFAEIELDEFGIARFYVVGQDPATNIDIRYCIPTVQIRSPADLVIVRGYDPPPRRELRTSFDGLKNAEIFEYEECAADSCDERAVGKYASISYDDPLLDQVYLDDIRNSYELAAFETLIGYIVDLDLPSGADPDLPNFRPGIKITFGDTTREYIKVGASLMNFFITPLNQTGGNSDLFGPDVSSGIGILTAFGGSNSSSVSFGSEFNGTGTTTVTVTAVDPKTDECSVEATSIAGSRLLIPASRFKRENKFGNLESDIIGVEEVVFSGRKVAQINIISFPTGGGGENSRIDIYVKPRKELIRLEQGKNWTWTFDAQGNLDLEFFSLLEDDFTATIAGIYQGNVGAGTLLFRHSTASPNATEQSGTLALGGLVANIGDRLGYLVLDDRLCVVVSRKRPSIDVFDPNGNAGELAREFLTFLNDPDSSGVVHLNQLRPGQRRKAGIRYTPIVIVDEPAPIAYAANAPLQSIDAQTGLPGSTVLSPFGIIDQSDGIRDSDPTTVQDFDESQLSVLQDNTNGSTIDISMPFCNGTECLQIAQNLLALQQATVSTQSMILGPTSLPKLGQVLPDGSIINEINYSYSDASQYLITVTAGPKYLTAGSFQNSAYQLQSEEVTREGTVVQDKGNGAEYVVRVEGFGEVNALSMILDQITTGDKVSVRLYNVPQERR